MNGASDRHALQRLYNRRASARLERLHDARLVRPSQAPERQTHQQLAALHRRALFLGDRAS